MKGRHTTRAPSLSDYTTPKDIHTNDREVWAQLAKWQAQGLLSIKPLSPQRATVALTDKGRETVATTKRGE